MKKKDKNLEKMLKEQGDILGNRLKEVMKEKNITPEELAIRVENMDPNSPSIRRELKKLGLAAKYFREKKNMTQQEVADKGQLSPAEIQRFEEGGSGSEYDTMLLICYALEISIYEVVSISDVIEP